MAKKSKKTVDEAVEVEKKPDDGGTPKDSVDSTYSSTINSTTNPLENQQISKEQDELKGRHFVFVVYPESAPEDWIEQLTQTGLAFVVSPLHDKDVNPDGTPKKEHYHVIVSWGNSTTYRSARGLCDMLNCPIPQMLRKTTGMYRYLTHKDNPEKYQYKEQPKCYNGWVRPLDDAEVATIKRDIWKMVYTEDCKEYGELLMVCEQCGAEYFDVASKHTIFFKAVCDGYRHNPVRTLMRRLKTLSDDEDREVIKSLLKPYLDAEVDVDTGEVKSGTNTNSDKEKRKD